MTLVAGLMPTFATFALVLPIAGLTSMTLMTAANSFVQMAADPAMRGRVLALYLAVFMGGTPLGAPLLGWIAEHAGARWTLIGGGGITALGSVLIAAYTAHRRGVVLTRYAWRGRHPSRTTAGRHRLTAAAPSCVVRRALVALEADGLPQLVAVTHQVRVVCRRGAPSGLRARRRWR